MPILDQMLGTPSHILVVPGLFQKLLLLKATMAIQTVTLANSFSFVADVTIHLSVICNMLLFIIFCDNSIKRMPYYYRH